MNGAIISRTIIKHRQGAHPAQNQDDIVVEEPLEIRLNKQPLSVTMRTPGDDHALALGFLFCEGLIKQFSDVKSIFKPRGSKDDSNTISIITRDEIYPKKYLNRHFYSNSSCGVCGKSSIDAIAECSSPIRHPPRLLHDSQILALADQISPHQLIFNRTGGLHAAALIDLNGIIIDVKEDIGRHNAVDKVIGSHLLKNATFENVSALFTSGRASFEILQKAVAAGISSVIAVGPPSSLAIEVAERFNLGLYGFASKQRFNCYSPALSMRSTN